MDETARKGFFKRRTLGTLHITALASGGLRRGPAPDDSRVTTLTYRGCYMTRIGGTDDPSALDALSNTGAAPTAKASLSQ